MAFDGRMRIEDIDDDERTVYFDTYKLKKMTGTRIGPIMGESEFSSPFKVACELAGLYPGDKPTKYIDAGNILEPVLRDYLGTHANSMLKGPLEIPEGSVASVEEPVPMEQCGYDHFHAEKLFGGLVDGYIKIDNVRDTILEIKTSGVREKWEDGNGGYTNVPIYYMYQASLYAELSGLDRIVFLVGFLEESDYDRPKQWVPTPDNTFIIVKEKLDMKPIMAKCEEWYNTYMKNGYTPEWTDSECDQEVLKYLKAFKRRKR